MDTKSDLKKRKRKFKEIDNEDSASSASEVRKKKKSINKSKIEGKVINNLSPKNEEKGLNTNEKEPQLEISESDLELIFEEAPIPDDKPKITSIYYINKNKTTINDLKDGRRIFNNKTELTGYDGFNENFIEFRQLLFPNLLLNEDFSQNLSEKWTMESALFSTFCYEEDFIEPLIAKYKVKAIVIRHAEGVYKNKPPERSGDITYITPKIDFTLKWGKFHSKLTIFKFPKFLRVIIPSANLTSGDWYYWGQIVWFQDFYLKEETKNYKESEFESYLKQIFQTFMPNNYETQDYYKQCGIDLSLYDFSNTVVDLIASTSGRFTGNSLKDYGVGRLKHLTKSYVKERPSLSGAHSRLLVQCSSIGKSLKEKFLTDLCMGFQCKVKDSPKLEIIYPTEEYVDSFSMGRQLSGCLFLGKDAYLLHKYKFRTFEVLEKVDKTIFHSKIFITCQDDEINLDNLSDNTIFYFGSHNLSIAAWGSLEKNDAQISMSNYELGIIFNPIKLKLEDKRKILQCLLFNLNAKFYSSDDDPFLQEFS